MRSVHLSQVSSFLFFDKRTRPDESYPRYSSRFKPSNNRGLMSLFVTRPTIPNISLFRRIQQKEGKLNQYYKDFIIDALMILA